LATIDMGEKWAASVSPYLGGAGYTHLTQYRLRRGLRTFIPTGILIHQAIWPQQIWAENWRGRAPLGEGDLGPHLTQCGPSRGLHAC